MSGKKNSNLIKSDNVKKEYPKAVRPQMQETMMLLAFAKA
jgi:hypothetical protein